MILLSALVALRLLAIGLCAVPALPVSWSTKDMCKIQQIFRNNSQPRKHKDVVKELRVLFGTEGAMLCPEFFERCGFQMADRLIAFDLTQLDVDGQQFLKLFRLVFLKQSNSLKKRPLTMATWILQAFWKETQLAFLLKFVPSLSRPAHSAELLDFRNICKGKTSVSYVRTLASSFFLFDSLVVPNVQKMEQGRMLSLLDNLFAWTDGFMSKCFDTANHLVNFMYAASLSGSKLSDNMAAYWPAWEGALSSWQTSNMPESNAMSALIVFHCDDSFVNIDLQVPLVKLLAPQVAKDVLVLATKYRISSTALTTLANCSLQSLSEDSWSPKKPMPIKHLAKLSDVHAVAVSWRMADRESSSSLNKPLVDAFRGVFGMSSRLDDHEALDFVASGRTAGDLSMQRLLVAAVIFRHRALLMWETLKVRYIDRYEHDYEGKKLETAYSRCKTPLQVLSALARLPSDLRPLASNPIMALVFRFENIDAQEAAPGLILQWRLLARAIDNLHSLHNIDDRPFMLLKSDWLKDFEINPEDIKLLDDASEVEKAIFGFLIKAVADGHLFKESDLVELEAFGDANRDHKPMAEMIRTWAHQYACFTISACNHKVRQWESPGMVPHLSEGISICSPKVRYWNSRLMMLHSAAAICPFPYDLAIVPVTKVTVRHVEACMTGETPITSKSWLRAKIVAILVSLVRRDFGYEETSWSIDPRMLLFLVKPESALPGWTVEETAKFVRQVFEDCYSHIYSVSIVVENPLSRASFFAILFRDIGDAAAFIAKEQLPVASRPLAVTTTSSSSAAPSTSAKPAPTPAKKSKKRKAVLRDVPDEDEDEMQPKAPRADLSSTPPADAVASSASDPTVRAVERIGADEEGVKKPIVIVTSRDGLEFDGMTGIAMVPRRRKLPVAVTGVFGKESAGVDFCIDSNQVPKQDLDSYWKPLARKWTSPVHLAQLQQLGEDEMAKLLSLLHYSRNDSLERATVDIKWKTDSKASKPHVLNGFIVVDSPDHLLLKLKYIVHSQNRQLVHVSLQLPTPETFGEKEEYAFDGDLFEEPAVQEEIVELEKRATPVAKPALKAHSASQKTPSTSAPQKQATPLTSGKQNASKSVKGVQQVRNKPPTNSRVGKTDVSDRLAGEGAITLDVAPRAVSSSMQPLSPVRPSSVSTPVAVPALNAQPGKASSHVRHSAPAPKFYAPSYRTPPEASFPLPSPIAPSSSAASSPSRSSTCAELAQPGAEQSLPYFADQLKRYCPSSLVVPPWPYMPLIEKVSPKTWTPIASPILSAASFTGNVVLNRHTLLAHSAVRALLPTLKGRIVAVDGEFSGIFSPAKLQGSSVATMAPRAYILDILQAVILNDSYQWGFAFTHEGTRVLPVVVEASLGKPMHCTSYPKVSWLFDPDRPLDQPSAASYMDRRLDSIRMWWEMQAWMKGRIVLLHDGLQDMLHLWKIHIFSSQLGPNVSVDFLNSQFASRVSSVLHSTPSDDADLLSNALCKAFCQDLGCFSVMDTKYMYRGLVPLVADFQKLQGALPSQHNASLGDMSNVVAGFPLKSTSPSSTPTHSTFISSASSTASLETSFTLHVSSVDALATMQLFHKLMSYIYSMSLPTAKYQNQLFLYCSHVEQAFTI